MGQGKMEAPRVSFCMSTYKRPVFLKQQLETILKQTFADFEIVLCDNDPESSAESVVKANGDPRIKYHPNIENLGMIKSFNRSIELSSGEYIVMITDDDPVYPDMLETLFDLKNKYPGYGMYLGGCDWFCTHHEVAKLYGLKVGTNTYLSNDHDLNYTEAFDPEKFVMDLFTFKIFQHYLWSTGMVKRDILFEMGGVPDYGTPFLGDYAYIGIMASHSGCVIINKSLGCQTLHNENFGRKQNEQLVVAAKNFTGYLDSKMAALKDWAFIRQRVQHFVGTWIVSHLTFLHKYADDKDESLVKAEKEIFAIDFMKKYKLKYFIKRRFPVLHNQLVSLKLKLKK
jgi:glycosyltransferase involved in cell wall biosynthesis